MKQIPIILLGAGGHAKVVVDLLHALDHRILGVCDPELANRGVAQWRGLPVLGNDEIIEEHQPDSIALANGIGSLPNSQLRRRLHQRFKRIGYRFITLVHPSSVLGSGVELGEGVQIMAGTIIQADTKFGNDAIVNTGVRIDHESVIGDHVHVAPGAVLSGNVMVADGCHIGPGAVVIQGIKLGQGAVVGAGTTVLSDLPAQCQLTGQPPRPPVELNRKKNTP